MKSEGAKTPPLPPEPIVRDVERILAKTRISIMCMAIFPSMAD
jgi:hypothetical protein